MHRLPYSFLAPSLPRRYRGSVPVWNSPSAPSPRKAFGSVSLTPRMSACLLLPSAVSPQTAVTWSTFISHHRHLVALPLRAVPKPVIAAQPGSCPESRAGAACHLLTAPAGSLRLRAVWVPSPWLHGHTIHCRSLAPAVGSHCRGSPRSALQVPLQRRCAVKPVARKRTEGRLDRTLSRCVIWIQGRPRSLDPSTALSLPEEHRTEPSLPTPSSDLRPTQLP